MLKIIMVLIIFLDAPDFKAKKPFIHVSIVKDKNGDYKTDWDVQSC